VKRRRQLGVKLRGCAGRVSVARVRKQKKTQLVSRKTLEFGEKSI
jgi:hypothetical protein